MSNDAVWRKAPERVIPRPAILKSYKESMLAYLKLKFPNVTDDFLMNQIEKDIKKKLKIPECQVITYPEVGEFDLRTIPLSTYIRNHNADVIAPCGTMFKSDPENIPPSVKYNNSCRLDRNKYKKMMFDCMEKGDTLGENRNDRKQQLRKVKNNSIIGGHGFEGCAFYDKESFNGITSLGRNGVILSYTLAEQCLANNFYWSDREKVINFIMATAQGAIDYNKQQEIEDVIKKYNLYVPDSKQVAKRLLESSKYYLSKKVREKLFTDLVEMFDNMPTWQMCYVFYRRNIMNLFTQNSDLFRELVDKLRTIDYDLQATTDYKAEIAKQNPEEALKLPGDLKMMLAIIYNRILGYKAVNKTLVKEHPEIAQEFVLIAKTAQAHLDKYEPIFKAFMYSGETIPRVMENKYIIRKAVAVSDTDSILFTMKAPVSWYLKDNFKICDDGIDMAAYTVYLLSKILNIANRDLAISKGSVGEAVDRINLKSEFLYAVFVKTDLGKHYFTKYLAKEGRVVKDPRIDIKGVELQSSTLPNVSKDFAKKLMVTIIDDVYKHGDVYERDLIAMCLEYEQTILNSLKSGELDYYSNVSLKEEAQYKQPDRSIWFNYRFWHEVFEEDYGVINIPGKYPVIPFKEKMPKDPIYLRWVEKRYPKIHKRYVKFLESVPKNKKITRIPIPGDLKKIPAVLIPLVDIRKIVYKNMTSAQLALKQLGINCGKQKQRPVMLDMYSNISIGQMQIDT